MNNGQFVTNMFRKKSNNSAAAKQYTEASSLMSRDTSVKKISERALRPLDKNITLSTELPRKSSLSHAKSGLKELQQSEKKAIRLFYSKKYEEAFEMLRSCLDQVERLQTVQHEVYVHYLYTEFYFKLNQYDQSLKHYHLSKSAYCSSSQQKKLTAYILNLECLHLSLLYQMGEMAEVLKLSEDLIEKIQIQSQQWFQCMWNRMKALFELDRYEQASEIGKALIEKATKVNYILKYTLKTAACLQKRGLHNKAMQILQNGIKEKEGKQYNALYGRVAQLSLMSGDIIKAIYCLEKIKRSHLEDPQNNEFKESCKALARLYSQAGDDRKCIQNCQEILQQAQTEDLLLFSDALARDHNKKQAIKIYQKILGKQFTQSSRLILFMRILPLLENSQLQAYEQQFLTAAQNFASGESVVALTQYANNIRKKGNYARAQFFYKQAAALSSAIQLPQYTFVIYCNLGEMFEDLEKKSQSSAFYTKALKLNVEHELAASVSSRINVMRG